MPIPARVEIRFDPPALMKGRAFPAGGSRPTITPMFMNASAMIQNVSPAAMTDPSESGACRATFRPRQRSSP